MKYLIPTNYSEKIIMSLVVQSILYINTSQLTWRTKYSKTDTSLPKLSIAFSKQPCFYKKVI